MRCKRYATWCLGSGSCGDRPSFRAGLARGSVNLDKLLPLSGLQFLSVDMGLTLLPLQSLCKICFQYAWGSTVLAPGRRPANHSQGHLRAAADGASLVFWGLAALGSLPSLAAMSEFQERLARRCPPVSALLFLALASLSTLPSWEAALRYSLAFLPGDSLKEHFVT